MKCSVDSQFGCTEDNGNNCGPGKDSLDKKGFMQKIFQIGGSTFLSRILGLVREVLLGRFLGPASMISDIFLTAYSIPNSLRKVFAEGALSASFIPTFVKVVKKDGIDSANKLMTMAFIFFEGVVLLLCYLGMWYAEFILHFVVPGWSDSQIATTAPYLRILMPFIFFISSSALIAGALNTVHHFFIPAFSPVLLNIVFISSLLTGIYFGMSVDFLCYCILFGGFLQLILHIIAYFRCGFSFEWFDSGTSKKFGDILLKFIPCLFAMSITEINFFIDRAFASHLNEGSISLIHYASGFMRIPLGVFAVSFATVLFPHLSRVSLYAPKRIGYYLFESFKFVCVIVIPIILIMSFFSKDIFYTLFAPKITLIQAHEASFILNAFLIGLLFFSINKVLLNAFYSLDKTLIPGLISAGATLINVLFNFMFVYVFKAAGLALATSLSTGLLQTVVFIYVLRKHFKLHFYGYRFALFLKKIALQIFLFGLLFISGYRFIEYTIGMYAGSYSNFLLQKFGLWFWCAPLSLAIYLGFLATRKFFGIKIYFLD